MPYEIIIPKVDMVMETGTFVEWLRNEGDKVEKGSPLFIIMTDKATIECEAPASGILAGISAKKDDVLPVTSVIGYILKVGENVPEKIVSAPVSKDTASVKSQGGKLSPIQEPPPSHSNLESIPQYSSDQQLLRATPLARTIARQMGINLVSIKGRGPRGRIYQADVIAAKQTSSPSTQLSKSSTNVATIQIPLPNSPIRQRIPLKGIRAIIAKKMAYSSSTIPHIYESVSVDMSEIVRMRDRINPIIQEKTGVKVSYTAIIALAVAKLLPEHAFLNSSLSNDDIILWQDVNIGIATSLEDYLIVPVIKNAQSKNLEGIVIELNRLVDAARNKKLEPSEMSGSTFTITNLGMFGIESFTAIINPPETAILAVGKMLDSPSAINGEVKIVPKIFLTLAVDHRVLDGAQAAKFLMNLKTILENPYLLT